MIMKRQEREEELRTMLTTQRGKEEILEILKKHAGIEAGNLPSFGTLLVETVLNYEFSPESGREVSADAELAVSEASSGASEPTRPIEPGDVKFSEPPGREAPGG
jgi:hypothetical protein